MKNKNTIKATELQKRISTDNPSLFDCFGDDGYGLESIDCMDCIFLYGCHYLHEKYNLIEMKKHNFNKEVVSIDDLEQFKWENQ